MDLLEPNFEQPRPSVSDIRDMCSRIQISSVSFQNEALNKFLAQVRQSHSNGGAYLTVFELESDPVFDWFASRGRLAEDGLLDWLLLNSAIRSALPEVYMRAPQRIESGLTCCDQFMLDGTLSRILYSGGAYSKIGGDGRNEKALALSVCEAMFGLRFGEVSCYFSDKSWTPWFKEIAWDVTAAVFDRRTRRLWILTVTDTD
jgi:hypothetical protein